MAFGLPYASDAALTRHIAAFLQQHSAAGWPDALLLNGGVFRAAAIAAPPMNPGRRSAPSSGPAPSAGSRERWPTAVLRPLFDALWQRARGRRRSADHERLWLSLSGWCLRPGFGDAVDGWRSEQLWPIFEHGVQNGLEPQVNVEWWTLWRRDAGGLDEAAQRRLLNDFAINLRGDEAGIRQRPPRLVTGGWDEMADVVDAALAEEIKPSRPR